MCLVVLIRQLRQGSQAVTLEIPGGLVDPGETPTQAGARELREETGYLTRELVHMGQVNPNPALYNNICHILPFWLWIVVWTARSAWITPNVLRW
jgi:8-oxo-dGTP pyrophosphatase MutT (NUDIX family)